MIEPLNARVVLSGNPYAVSDCFERLASWFTHRAGRPGVVNRPTLLWEAIEQSMHQFDQRVVEEARHSSILSIGSTLHDWAGFEHHLPTTQHEHRSDKVFARRYLSMYRSTSIRHAQRNYDVVLHIDDHVMPTALATAIAACGCPVIYHSPQGPVQKVLDEIERLTRDDLRTK